MKIDIIKENMDMSITSYFKDLLISIFDNAWEDYKTVYMEENPSARNIFVRYFLHREDGPAAIKYDGSSEWWYQGKKFDTEKQFNSFMKNKAFW
jgi:hypothetical protein